MRLHLYGGFGEKGRTCLGVEVDGYRLLLDAGVKTSARGADYYPAISAEELAATDAIVITHAHEDHVAALGWCIAGGFRGRLLMTAETGREVDLLPRGVCRRFASPRCARVCARGSGGRSADCARPAATDRGPLRPRVGWRLVRRRRRPPHARLLRRRRSGERSVCDGPAAALRRGRARRVVRRRRCERAAARERSARLGARAPRRLRAADAAQRPLGGAAGDCAGGDRVIRRHASSLAAADRRSGMAGRRYGRAAFAAAGARGRLARRARRCRAPHCSVTTAWASPVRRAKLWQQAAAADHPVLFTGHLPADSPGERMLAAGQAAWLRLPTHPTLSENVAIAGIHRGEHRPRSLVRARGARAAEAPHSSPARRPRHRRPARALSSGYRAHPRRQRRRHRGTRPRRAGQRRGSGARR